MVATVMKTRRKREGEETKEVRAVWRRGNMAVRRLMRRWRSPALYLCHMASERSKVRYECVCVCVCWSVSLGVIRLLQQCPYSQGDDVSVSTST